MNAAIRERKNKDNGKLFCICETCGSVWEDIKDVLKNKLPSNMNIVNFENAAREEIISAGWDKYDDIFYL